MRNPWQLLHVLALSLCVSCGQGLPGAATAQPPAQPPAQPSGQPGALLSYADWQAACGRLPSNRSLQGRLPPKHLLPLPAFAAFETALSAMLNESVHGALSDPSKWAGGPPAPGFFDTNNAYFLKPAGGGARIPFQPFAQKLVVPPGSEVFVRGDLHGDIHSLMANLRWLNEQGFLRGFEIARPDFYMLFLGDLTDRGAYGIEVLYTVFRLKTANPDRVFLARGNHEDISLLARYGFVEEGRGKYGAAFNAAKIARAFDFLPVVIYLGSSGDFIQCNHGGMEPGYNPRSLLAAEGSLRFQLIGPLRQQTFAAQNPGWLAGADTASRDLARRALQDFHPEDPVSPSVLGFMWNDFSLLSSDPQFGYDPGRAFIYGQDSTRFILAQAGAPGQTLHAVFRAHQHSAALNPMMRRLVASGGVFRHWQAADSPALLNAAVRTLATHLETGEERPIPSGSVWTFNVGADSYYGEGCGFSFDTFGLLKTAPSFADWRLKRVNVQPGP